MSQLFPRFPGIRFPGSLYGHDRRSDAAGAGHAFESTNHGAIDTEIDVYEAVPRDFNTQRAAAQMTAFLGRIVRPEIREPDFQLAMRSEKNHTALRYRASRLPGDLPVELWAQIAQLTSVKARLSISATNYALHAVIQTDSVWVGDIHDAETPLRLLASGNDLGFYGGRAWLRTMEPLKPVPAMFLLRSMSKDLVAGAWNGVVKQMRMTWQGHFSKPREYAHETLHLLASALTETQVESLFSQSIQTAGMGHSPFNNFDRHAFARNIMQAIKPHLGPNQRAKMGASRSLQNLSYFEDWSDPDRYSRMDLTNLIEAVNKSSEELVPFRGVAMGRAAESRPQAQEYIRPGQRKAIRELGKLLANQNLPQQAQRQAIDSLCACAKLLGDDSLDAIFAALAGIHHVLQGEHLKDALHFCARGVFDEYTRMAAQACLSALWSQAQSADETKALAWAAAKAQLHGVVFQLTYREHGDLQALANELASLVERIGEDALTAERETMPPRDLSHKMRVLAAMRAEDTVLVDEFVDALIPSNQVSELSFTALSELRQLGHMLSSDHAARVLSRIVPHLGRQQHEGYRYIEPVNVLTLRLSKAAFASLYASASQSSKVLMFAYAPKCMTLQDFSAEQLQEVTQLIKDPSLRIDQKWNGGDWNYLFAIGECVRKLNHWTCTAPDF